MSAAAQIIVSVHDVAPQTQAACERVIRAIDAVASIPLTLLVVPDYHHAGLRCATARYRAWLETRLARGDELALHGWTHLDEAPLTLDPIERFRRTRLTDREGEFAALTATQARERLEAGLAWFDQQGWPLAGFIPPAWQMSAGSWEALQSAPLIYTATRTHLHLLHAPPATGQSIATCTFVYSTRTRLRSRLSLLVNGARARLDARAQLVRLALHPQDADDARVRSHWQMLLERLLHGREAITKAAAATAAITARAPRQRREAPARRPPARRSDSAGPAPRETAPPAR